MIKEHTSPVERRAKWKARSRTLDGRAAQIHYAHMRLSKAKKEKLPDYGIAWFHRWLRGTNYSLYYKTWASSGFKKELEPNVVKIAPDKPYQKDNLTVTTFKVNKTIGYKSNRIAICAIPIAGGDEITFNSGKEAGAAMKTWGKTISDTASCVILKASNGKPPNTAYGYRWYRLVSYK